MAAQERINAVLQQAILSLCKVNYSDKIEIDGIICISSLKTQQQDVVKIHQTIEPQQSAPSNKTLVESALALSLGVNREKTTAQKGGVEELSKSTTAAGAPETPGGAKKTPKGRKRNRKVQDDDPDFSSKAKAGTAETAESESAKKLRRSTKKPKVSYAEASPVDSELSDFIEDYVEEPVSGNERYGLSDTASQGGQNVSFGSASVLLKLLADPRAKKMGKQGKKSVMDTVLKGAGLLSGMRQEVLPLTQTSQQMVHGSKSQENHAVNKDTGTTEVAMEDSTIVKEEPDWDDGYEIAQTSQAGETTANDMDVANAREDSVESNLTDGAQCEDPQTVVKMEPEWDEAEYGSPAGPMLGTSAPRSGGSKEDNSAGERTTGKGDTSKVGADGSKTSGADSRKSILMNILKGPPLIDSLHKQKPGVFVDNEDNSDSRESLPKASTSEQDNSLLYRLPYASFSELLFPHSSKNILLNQSDSERGERQLSTIDYLTNLQQTHGNIPISQIREHYSSSSGRGRYKTRLKSGSTDPVRYKDLVGATDNILPDEEVDEALKESTEDVYIPEVDPYETEGDQIQPDSSRRKGRPKFLSAKFVKGKGGRKDQDDLDMSGDRGTQLFEEDREPESQWAGTYFRCKICTRIFADKVSRDEHEEEERQTLQAHQCPICDGFFGSEETKAIHMEERHGIQTLTPEQRATILKKMGRKDSPYNKRKPYTTKRYLSDRSADKPKEAESIVREKETNIREKETNVRSQEKAAENDTENVEDSEPAENDTQAPEVKSEKEVDAKKIQCSFCDMLFDNDDSKMEHLIYFHGVSSENYGNVYT